MQGQKVTPSEAAPAAQPGQAGISAELAQFLEAVRAPLRFLAQASPEVASRTEFPAAELAQQGRALLSGLATAAQRGALAALCAALERVYAVPASERGAMIARCRAELGALETALAAPPADVAYRRFTGNLERSFELLSRPVQFLKGVGPQRAQDLQRFGIETVEDLLYHLPFRYEDRRTVTPIRALRIGETATVVGELVSLQERFVGRVQRHVLQGVLRDATGSLALVWFHQLPFFKNNLVVGERYRVYGRVEGSYRFTLQMAHPDVEAESVAAKQQSRVLPVYQKPGRMALTTMRRIVQQAVQDFASYLPSVLPAELVAEMGVMDLTAAMEQLHLPDNNADVEALNLFRSLAHRSLVFDELFFLQLGMQLRRRSVEKEKSLVFDDGGALAQDFLRRLPFALTAAQQRVIREITSDLQRGHPMHRLVQGDVGSGKTVVALYAALVAIANGAQCAFMAPTELLAEQHYRTITRLAEGLPVRVALLTGAVRRREREPLLREIAAGDIHLVVGTHALIQEGVRFANLGLGVIDEQHRFGVLQRAALHRLGCRGEASPHILLMTATPIPRTLTMTLYGDLDVSLLDELPPGRKPVQTFLRGEAERAEVYALVKRELDRGRQAYIVYPLVEGGDDSELRDATTMAKELARTVFQGYRVGLVHGRMKPAEKDAVMRRFQAGEVQLLVSTTVIEVGIDVPNATVMVVEHAERFGLSQLHQLRGRVGRGADESYCILLASYRRGDDTERRLQAMKITDGFQIAEIDLELRGPGELLGTRQAGVPDFRVANVVRDRVVLEQARAAAEQWLAKDPELRLPESRLLRAVLKHRWADRLELAQIG
ncbi:MAG: ATP-dependent DNA helicase RecG [Candidatus Binatia bacterium]|nr:ATP-dependent DNA helicase RecG [Candidatus Binatia bacterium]